MMRAGKEREGLVLASFGDEPLWWMRRCRIAVEVVKYG